MEKQKKIFIASSTEARPLAVALANYLGTNLTNLETREWYDPNTFPPTEDTLQSLINQANECDFAAVLLTKDDFSQKRGERLDAPRDNTIFELGLFMGALGLDLGRCFMVCGVTDKNALPSDLRGRTYIPIIQPPNLDDDAACRQSVKLAASVIVGAIKKASCFAHPKLPLITRGDLADLERGQYEGGNLLLEPDSIAVVVNSVEPVEQLDPQFSVTVLKNIRAGAKYEYFYGDFENNIAPTANLVLKVAMAELMPQVAPPKQLPQVMKENLESIRWNLQLMQKSLSIHFRRRPPLQFCVHNALSEEAAICYLRYDRNNFARWAEQRPAKDIAEELTTSCNTRERDCCIFHSTTDFPLNENPALDDAMNKVIKDRRARILKLITDRFPKDLHGELNQICLGA